MARRKDKMPNAPVYRGENASKKRNMPIRLGIQNSVENHQATTVYYTNYQGSRAWLTPTQFPSLERDNCLHRAHPLKNMMIYKKRVTATQNSHPSHTILLMHLHQKVANEQPYNLLLFFSSQMIKKMERRNNL